ncbi:hypothetical protein JQN64_27565, partial [Escherichia coli]|nr:hypothetical protein [Escherichia coli]
NISNDSEDLDYITDLDDVSEITDTDSDESLVSGADLGEPCMLDEDIISNIPIIITDDDLEDIHSPSRSVRTLCHHCCHSGTSGTKYYPSITLGKILQSD